MDSTADRNFKLVIPKDFPLYIKKIGALLIYADNVIKHPRVDKPTHGLEELADLKFDLLKNKVMINEYLEHDEFSKEDYRVEVTKLRDSLEGRLDLMEGSIEDLFSKIKEKYV